MIPQSGWLAKPRVVPGLDIDMNEELIAEHPYKASFVNLSADDRQKRQSAERPLVPANRTSTPLDAMLAFD